MKSVAIALTERGFYTEALRAVRDLEANWGRTETLCTMAGAFPEAGEEGRAEELFDEALQLAQDIKVEWGRPGALGAVAAALAQAGDEDRAERLLDESVELLRSIKDEGMQRESLDPLVWALSWAGRYDQALELVRDIEVNPEQVARLQSVVVNHLALAECYDQALEVAQDIEVDQTYRAEALIYVATILAEAGEEDRAEELYSEALQSAQAIRQASGRILGLVEPLADAGRFSDALAFRSEGWSGSVYHNDPDQFLKDLSEWEQPFERLQPGLSITVLGESLGVAGWWSPYWQRVYKVVQTSDSTK